MPFPKIFKHMIVDGKYNVKQECTLGFLKRTDFELVRIAINWQGNLVMIQFFDPYVYICDKSGTLKHKFEHDSTWPPNLCISKQNEVIASAQDDKTIHIYDMEGYLKSTIKVPQDHEIYGISFHHVIGKIIVLTFVTRKNSYFLLCYTEAGDLETTTFFCKISRYEVVQITSHPCGPAIVARSKSITFI